MTPASLLVYLGLCALIGYVGREKKFGFVGNFFISLFFTPVIGFVVWLFQSNTKTTVVVKS